MKSYAIGEVSRILGVKPHVIRYWEQAIPLVAPKKGLSGRREYSPREIKLLLRLKHHLHENCYTLEGARRRIWKEIESGRRPAVGLADEIRRELTEVLSRIRELGS